MQYGITFSCLAVMLSGVQCAIPLSVRHGFNSILPLQAPPLDSYRYSFHSVHHSSRGFGGDGNSTDNPLNDIITNLHKLESMFFGNNSFFHSFNFKHKRNRTRLSFPKWFNSWPDFDDSSEEGSGEGTTDDPCGGGGFFDFSDFDGIIMEIKSEIDNFFSDMNSIFPNFHKGRNSTDSSSEEEWDLDNFLDDIKKSFDKKHKNGNGKEGDSKPEEREKETIEKIQEPAREKVNEPPTEKLQETPVTPTL